MQSAFEQALRAAANCAAVVVLLPPLVLVYAVASPVTLALPAQLALVVRVRVNTTAMVMRKRVFIGKLHRIVISAILSGV